VTGSVATGSRAGFTVTPGFEGLDLLVPLDGRLRSTSSAAFTP
jgi:hypothetical protein